MSINVTVSMPSSGLIHFYIVNSFLSTSFLEVSMPSSGLIHFYQ